MSENNMRSILEIMNDVLSTVRDYYDAEYAYYIEKDEYEIVTIYEWCAENIPWQRDQIKMLDAEHMPRWVKNEITDTRDECYSVFHPLDEGRTAILAVVNVRRGGCEPVADAGGTALYFPDDHPAQDPEAAGISQLPRRSDRTFEPEQLCGISGVGEAEGASGL